jgi:hypothetical protein
MPSFAAMRRRRTSVSSSSGSGSSTARWVRSLSALRQQMTSLFELSTHARRHLSQIEQFRRCDGYHKVLADQSQRRRLIGQGELAHGINLQFDILQPVPDILMRGRYREGAAEKPGIPIPRSAKPARTHVIMTHPPSAANSFRLENLACLDLKARDMMHRDPLGRVGVAIADRFQQ